MGGLVLLTGVMDSNGGLTAKLEAKAMGGGDLFAACEEVTLYEMSSIPELGRENVRFFNVLVVEAAVISLPTPRNSWRLIPGCDTVFPAGLILPA
ncbi:MAG: hypothetical protein V3S39_03140 [Thermodesulfobacteriota bacterium]